jgi:hypothetical protein
MKKKIAAWKGLSWKPRRSQDRYCAPACGRGCTFDEHERAVISGQDLAKKLSAAFGGKWTPKVWENMGWYYKAISPCGRLEVYGDNGHYLEYLGQADTLSGLRVNTHSKSGQTPMAAVNNVLKVAKADLARLSALLTGL